MVGYLEQVGTFPIFSFLPISRSAFAEKSKSFSASVAYTCCCVMEGGWMTAMMVCVGVREREREGEAVARRRSEQNAMPVMAARA